MPACLICKTAFEPFISFGPQPIANGFLTQAEVPREPFYELRAGFCSACKMVQLADIIDREKMFHENYAFFSGTSKRMAAHFEEMARSSIAKHLGENDPFVVEIGSNDGIMLQHFATRGIRHLGVEPSANVAEVARVKGVRTVSRFFDERLAREIVAEDGQADLFLGANVFCHIPDLHSVVAGIHLLLKPKGVFLFEDPYLGDIVQNTSYDQIYDEHAFYFSVMSLSKLFADHGLEIIDVEHQEVHGGSMRYTVAHKGAHKPSPAVAAQLDKERAWGLDKAETYAKFRANVERSRDELVALLKKLNAEGKRVVGYGATSKSTTVTNYCKIGPDLIEFICDTTPIKQDKLNPGTHIPVRPPDAFHRQYPDYALLLAWNHREEILAKEQSFKAAGGKWIVYVPKVQVLE